MDPIWIAVAFILGFGGRLVGLPPLVGFLAAGFALQAFGVEGGEALDKVADLGVYLLLFGIGLKLNLKSLARPEIWGVTSLHMLITTLLFALAIFGLGFAGAGLIGGLDFTSSLLIAFALSFSSTVFAVKVLEESGESSALHGRIAIGILIVQDIFAIVFLTIALGKMPSIWSLGLLALPLVRPLLMWIMSRCGHGELLVLLGVLFVYASTWLFKAVDLKPDLGALVMGILVGSHPKASELSKVLMGFKDLFLVGFFLSVGLRGAPTFETIGIALILTLVMPLKSALFFFLMTKFKLRVRTSLLGSLSLSNYSEFGLIVGAVGAANGWITDEWLIIIALALSMTFIVTAPLGTRANLFYDRFADRLRPFEKDERVPGDEVIDPGDAKMVIFGMSRIGTSAYDEIHDRYGDIVVGVDRDPDVVKQHGASNRRVILGDATDIDLYAKVHLKGFVRIILLTMSNHRETLAAANTLREIGYEGTIAATAQHDDEIQNLTRAGVQSAFDLYANAGIGIADHICEQVDLVSETNDEANPGTTA